MRKFLCWLGIHGWKTTTVWKTTSIDMSFYLEQQCRYCHKKRFNSVKRNLYDSERKEMSIIKRGRR